MDRVPLKSKEASIIAKVSALPVNLNADGCKLASRCIVSLSSSSHAHIL
jgi:hypothetical protein